MSDLDEVVRGASEPTGPDDVARRVYFAAALGLLRSIRLIVVLCLGLEIYGRVLQTLYLFTGVLPK